MVCAPEGSPFSQLVLTKRNQSGASSRSLTPPWSLALSDEPRFTTHSNSHSSHEKRAQLGFLVASEALRYSLDNYLFWAMPLSWWESWFPDQDRAQAPGPGPSPGPRTRTEPRPQDRTEPRPQAVRAQGPNHCLSFSRSATPDSVRPRGLQPPGPPIHGILQARTLDWVAISSSRATGPPGNSLDGSFKELHQGLSGEQHQSVVLKLK